MQPIRSQPAGPKAFLLYSIVRDTYRREIGERAFAVYEALTYYVDPKTLQGPVPLKLLAQTVQRHPTTVSRYLHRLWQSGLITITPQWDAFGCVQDVNLYALATLPLRSMPLRRPQTATPSAPAPRRHTPRLTLLRCPPHRGSKGPVTAQLP